MSIVKQYAPWVLSVGGALEAIQKAERISEFLRTRKGAEMYTKYLREGGQAETFLTKSQPTPGDVHVNAPLTNVSIAFLAQQQFLADVVFPNVPVQKKSDDYFEYPRDQWFNTDAKERPPGSESAGSGYALTTSQYACRVIALHKDVADEARANADPMINLDRDATEFVTRQLAIKRERDWATKFFKTGVWTGSSTGTDITPSTLWSAGSSAPIDDLDKEIDSIQVKTGFRPNTVVLGQDVWTILKNHPDLLERIKYTEKAIVFQDLLASILQVKRVLVASAVHNVAKEGASRDMQRIVGTKDALVCYAAESPSLMQPSAGYTFSWAGYLGAGPGGQRMTRFRMQHLRSDRVEGEMAYDQKVIAPDLGAFFDGAVA